jgi:GNAT superfamily N-acetyltransferase
MPDREQQPIGEWMMPVMEVRDLTAGDWPAWRRMWSANCAHYGASMPEAGDRELWRRIMDPEHPVGALACGAPDADGTLVGLAHYVVHPHTFSDRMVCYLEDLWVEPAARRAGVGRRLIDALVARGREQGWRRLYWHTEADNVAGRALYDRVARLTNYVRYDIALT